MESKDSSWVGLGSWQEVASGLRMFMAYIIVNLSFSVLLVLITVGAAAGGGMQGLSAVVGIAKIGAVVGVGIALLGLAAIWRYSQVAEESGGRGLARASFWFGVGALALALVSLVRLMGTSDLESMAATNVMDILSKLLGVTQFFCLLASMRRVAWFISRFDLAELAGTTMILAGVTVILAVLGQLMQSANALLPVVIFGLGTLGIGIWCLVYLFMLLSRLARAVSQDVQLPGTFA